MNYRREIDGLRAVAVLPVVLFHGGFEFMSGGFAGVDVFFVISGYLITALILEDLERGRFSLLSFYERRARRILPALFVMLAVCAVFALLWMPPSQMIFFSKAMAAVALFASNVFFWRNRGYFDVGSESNPLLHTWSLAVEEQFYILFPLFMILVWRFGRRPLFWLLVVFAIGSLGLSELGWRYKAWANFYLLPTRAWELLAGSLCAVWLASNKKQDNDLFAAGGLVALLLSFVLFDAETPFPSLWAVVPVGGTVLLILFSGAGTWTGRLLSLKPLVGIGLISYSVYLWHQPLLAFLRIRSVDTPSSEMLLLAALASIPIGYLSWRFVERPWRNGSGSAFRSVPRRRILGLSAAGLCVVLGFGVAGAALEGFRGRFDPGLLAIDDARYDTSPLTQACYVETPAGGGLSIGALPRSECTFPAADGSIDVAILGDSHADSISYPVMKALQDAGVGVTTLSLAACVPFEGYWHTRARCDQTVAEVLDWVLNSDIKTIVLAGRYSLYVRDDSFDNGIGGVETDQMGPKTFYQPLVRGQTADATLANGLHVFRNGIRRYLGAGKEVVLVYPIPEAGWSVPDRFFKERLVDPDKDQLTIPYAAFADRNDAIIQLFDAIEADGLTKVKPHESFCDQEAGVCFNAVGDTVYYYDDDHLSTAGATLLVDQIVAPILESHAKSKVQTISYVR